MHNFRTKDAKDFLDQFYDLLYDYDVDLTLSEDGEVLFLFYNEDGSLRTQIKANMGKGIDIDKGDFIEV